MRRPEIASIVIDTMLRSIVEAHFAVWYVWHVPTGTRMSGHEGVVDIPDLEVPTIVEQWFRAFTRRISPGW